MSTLNTFLTLVHVLKAAALICLLVHLTLEKEAYEACVDDAQIHTLQRIVDVTLQLQLFVKVQLQRSQPFEHDEVRNSAVLETRADVSTTPVEGALTHGAVLKVGLHDFAVELFEEL